MCQRYAFICKVSHTATTALDNKGALLLSRKDVKNLNYISEVEIFQGKSFIMTQAEYYKERKNLSVEQNKILKPYWTFSKYVNVISLNAMLYIVYINWDDQQHNTIISSQQVQTLSLNNNSASLGCWRR